MCLNCHWEGWMVETALQLDRTLPVLAFGKRNLASLEASAFPSVNGTNFVPLPRPAGPSEHPAAWPHFLTSPRQSPTRALAQS